MQTVVPRRPFRSAVLAVALTATVLTPVVTGPAARADQGHAAVTDRRAAADFTAGVRSIAHGPAVVTLVGTGPAGGSVGVTADGIDPVWTEAGADERWTATVRLRPGSHVLHVTSQVTGQAIDVPVEVLVLFPPEALAVVDGIARTIALEGTAHPGAHLVVREGDAVLDEVDVAADGTWATTLRGLAFGDHHVEVWQYFDGTHNGGVDDVYRVSGTAAISTATASRATGLTTLGGRAPAGTTLRLTDDDGPVTDASGAPVEVRVGADTRWQVSFPFPEDVRFQRVTVTTFDSGAAVGSAVAHVTVPVALTGTAEELPDGRVRLSGTGEVGGVVSLEDDAGTAVTGADGEPVQTPIGRTWQLVLPRDVLPGDVVIARQRVDGVEQGALRLVLPARPGRPGPGAGGGPATDPGASTAVHEAPGAGALRHGAAGRAVSPSRLAYTGADVAPAAAAALGLLGLGVATLLTARSRRRGTGRR